MRAEIRPIFRIPPPVTTGTISPGDVTLERPDATTVIVHKLMAESYIDGLPFDHNGGMLSPEELAALGSQVTEVNGVEFSYYEVTAAQLEEMKSNPSEYNTVEKVNAYVNGVPAGTITTADGEGASVLLEEGYYWFVESGAPETLTPYAGTVPFGISVPISNSVDVGEIPAGAGYLKKVHIYPKNMNEKPTADKTFGDDDKTDKERDYDIGSVIPYEVTTTIPAGTRYQTASWSDQMTEGLTFNQDATVVIGETTAVVDTHYTIVQTDRGFKISLTDAGLALINNQTTSTDITITYTATLNEKAVVEIPESNDVTFNYGNNPDHGNTPVPTKPKDGEITVIKSWVDKDNNPMVPPAGVVAELTLYNAQTGAMVTFDDDQSNPVVLNAENGWTHTWTGLDPDTEYKVVETYNGYSAEYGVGELGTITVKNWKDDNPEPIKPEEPKVKTYGKKFVKTDDKEERLEGAEFVVYKVDGETTLYLKRKDNGAAAQDLQTYLAAEAEYQAAVAATNPDLAEIARLKEARDLAFAAKNMQWEWTANIDEAVIFTSNANGQFEVYGLEAGTYFLKETKAPEGYVIRPNDLQFEVGSGTYASGDISFEPGGSLGDAMQVKNVKVTIPQTGGIGTVIFAVVGLALMAGAVVAFRRKEVETE